MYSIVHQHMGSTLNDSACLITHLLAASGTIPNYPRWPLLLYSGAVAAATPDLAATFEALFDHHGWPAAWRNGIYPFHHFHCAAHEVLGVYSGEVTALFGGDAGVVITARPGDVIVLPAGTAHKKLSSRGTLGSVGAYPAGQYPDLCRPSPSSLASRITSIANVARPQCDPVYGECGPLLAHWK
jgi:uncharacterized protein YjlB